MSREFKLLRRASCQADARAFKDKAGRLNTGRKNIHHENREKKRSRNAKKNASRIKPKIEVKKKVYKIKETGNPNSCIIHIGKTRWRALVDTGADVSVISSNMYRRLAKKPSMKRVTQQLQGAGGAPLEVKGIVELQFMLGKSKYTQKCYVVNDASRNMILGCDFLKKNNARIYFDLEKLRLNDEYVELDQDIHIASVVRLATDITLSPQSKRTIEGKTKKCPYFEPGQLCEFKQDGKSWVNEEPGLLLANSVSVLDRYRRCKALLVNTTNKTYTLKRGCVIGTISVVDDADMSNIAEVTRKSQPRDLPKRPNFEDAKVPAEYKNVLHRVLSANSDVFAAHDTDYGRTDTVTMKIDTQGHPPIKQRPYRIPLAQQHIVDEAVEEMLEKGIIERSSSPWASPIVLVKKKDGSTRFCVDYRKLNDVSKALAVPLPLIDDLLGILGKAVYFSTLDLISGYWQVMLHPPDREKTAFVSHRGLYEFTVMPFGLASAPGIFTQLISKVLEGYESFSTSYIDDVLVFSETLEDHLEHLQAVFSRLRQHGLKLKLKKCSFLQPETSYLGYKIAKDGIRPQEDKVEAIRQLNPPISKKEIRSFIGSCSYYRIFLPNFSGIAND